MTGVCRLHLTDRPLYCVRDVLPVKSYVPACSRSFEMNITVLYVILQAAS